MLSAGWQKAGRKVSRELALAPGQVIEEPTTGFCGAVIRWENGIVVLEDRHGARRSFPIGPGFWYEGEPVTLKVPPRPKRTHTRSGSRTGGTPAAETLASRIFVEGKHDAQLVKHIWGEDLRHVGVEVVELGGIDDLAEIIEEFAPTADRKVGVLVDHLVTDSKESKVAASVAGVEHVLVTGHRFVDIWTAIAPARVGLDAWPEIPMGTDYKTGICAHLGWPHETPADLGRAWQRLLGSVRSWRDLDRGLVREVEVLIDFVTS